jgi:FkbM family methyltransferase
MLAALKKRAWEFTRCTRHNLLHLKIFDIRYDGRAWHVRDRHGLHLTYPYYPYNTFYQIEGYLRQGRWQLHEGMVVIDGGGCYGEFSMYASRRVGPTGRVLMLEPDPENIDRANELFSAQGGKPANLDVVQAGLWTSPGVMRLAAGQGESSVLLEKGAQPPQGAHVVEVPLESLQSLTEKFSLPRLDLVKLDIEGAEIEVVQSVTGKIRQMAPKFSIASYHVRGGKPTSALLEPMFQKLGYAVDTGFPDHQTTWAAAGAAL